MTAAPAIEIATDAQDRRVPRLGGSEVAVAEVVYACHELTIDQGLARVAISGLDRTTLEPILTYCAEERCIADAASCPGCRRRSEVEGVASFDQFIARHREIVVGDGSVRLTGTGEGTLHVDSLEALAKTWSGEKYWYWARRVLRKLRHGIRRAHLQGAAFAGEGETPAILLMEPQLADNVGMVARAMANFGLDALRLIAPRDGWPNEKARIAASGANFVIDDARPAQARDDAGRSGRRDADADCARGALRGVVRAGTQRAGDGRGRQRRRAHHDPGQFSFRFAQPGTGGADPRL
jgi:tRNA/rRNA methyltransferase